MKLGMIKDLSGEYKQSGCGWKIHLAVSSVNHEYVYEWLLSNCPFGCKYGMSDQVGKDFTIYVGCWANVVDFAGRLMAEIGPFLLPVQGDALKDDLKLSDKVAARFDAPRDEVFHQYGSNGLPYFKEDMARASGIFGYKKSDFDVVSALKKSFDLLYKRYKEYFTGNNPEDLKKLIGIS